MRTTLSVLGLDLPAHGTFVLLGVLVGALVYRWAARRHGMHDSTHALVGVSAVVVGVAGAKIATSWQWLVRVDDPTFGGFVLFGGKSILGGLLGAWLGAELAKRWLGVTHSTGDLFAPAVAAAMVVGRVGCLLTEYPGTPTSLPWAMTVPAEVAATLPACPGCNGTLHPSFAYEILFHGASLVAIVGWGHKVKRRGEVFRLWILAYGVTRFFLEFVRGNPTMVWGMSGSQLFLAVTMPLLAWRIWRTATSGLYRAPNPDDLLDAVDQSDTPTPLGSPS